ncbi:hypothetical protein Godav_011169 [Gossypium davidsonii]|uniref:RNase H type-1 domain-containing protein n=1 Tax=Gossypium davidsonii TaxID=34287 RepID=A0A7J8R9L0_GOSDV|nr:hypothetical protein [Gossypium davidsonii]
MLKLGFNILDNTSALWVQVLMSKNSVRCWKDNWIPELGTLVNQILHHVNLNMGCRLKDMVIEEGRLNLDLLKVWLSGGIIKRIVSIPSPHPSIGQDILSWARSRSRLLTLVEWVRHGIGEDEWCLLCGHTLEDVLYAIRDCSTVKRVWSQIIPSKWIQGKLLRKGILRDHHGKWVIRFNRRLGLCSVLNVELWGILDGLTVLNIKNWDKVSIRTDRVEVIQAI